MVVMHLWNWLMPELAGAGRIGFWQAFGLIVLARLLVGGIHHGVRGEDRWRGRFSPFYPVPDEARAAGRSTGSVWHRGGVPPSRNTCAGVTSRRMPGETRRLKSNGVGFGTYPRLSSIGGCNEPEKYALWRNVEHSPSP
jgi:hypothetical protein